MAEIGNLLFEEGPLQSHQSIEGFDNSCLSKKNSIFRLDRFGSTCNDEI